MKCKYSIVLLLVTTIALFTACSMRDVEERLDAAEDAVEDRMDAAEDKIEGDEENTNKTTQDSLENAQPTDNPDGENEGEITKEEAETIALGHAGFTADSVLRLHTEYEIDDGVPEYDVRFDKDGWEYDYSIHAQTGAILSHDKDND